MRYRNLTLLAALASCTLSTVPPREFPGALGPGLPSCEKTILPKDVGRVGVSCRASQGEIIRLNEDLFSGLPVPGGAAYVSASYRAGSNHGPTEAAVVRTKSDRVAVRVGHQAPEGDSEAIAELNRLYKPNTAEAALPANSAPLGGCGSSSMWVSFPGKWHNSTYYWMYNPMWEPNAGALLAIKYGFLFMTNSSSPCGTVYNSADHGYVGTNSQTVYGTTDGYNTVGWATWGGSGNILAMTWVFKGTDSWTAEGDIAFNRDFAWSTDLGGVVSSSAYDVINVATHEAGHIFGMGDIRDWSWSSQVMYGEVPLGVNRREKRSGDLAGISARYN